jgi:oxygen-independent coproporphyrinogen-3 oxidase
MFEMAHEALTAAGYEHYEISNYCRPGFRSKHNSRYWEREDWIGIGAGAHSALGTERWANVSDVLAYCRAMESGKRPVEWQETISKQNAADEVVMLGLRTKEGLLMPNLSKLGYMLAPARIGELVRRGLVHRERSRIKLTMKGMLVLDEIAAVLASSLVSSK